MNGQRFKPGDKPSEERRRQLARAAKVEALKEEQSTNAVVMIDANVSPFEAARQQLLRVALEAQRGLIPKQTADWIDGVKYGGELVVEALKKAVPETRTKVA